MSVSNLSKRRGKILDEIMAYHRNELPKRMREVSLTDLKAMAMVTRKPVDFHGALKASGVTLIAECKKASPSRGLMVPNYKASRLARTYEENGAGAISVLTDGRHFQGSLTDLRDVKETVRVPVLRKDFIFDPYQVYESRVAGADAVLLIASVLEGGEMKALLDLTHKLKMTALVEVHTEEELERVLPLGPRVVGVNNRNLQTFEVDFENTARLRAMIPEDVAVVGESGLKNTADIQYMKHIGVDAVLVGETLVTSKDVGEMVAKLVKAGR
ncbi:MAG TPA: indole-3-glycerol phosphate synthase TrpC [Anaerolineae bacterium]|nr:indole-3-glycerol phosphate synthase TrpC [Anaerolineae bacterium]